MRKATKYLYWVPLVWAVSATNALAQDLTELQVTPDYGPLLNSLMNRIPVFLGAFAFLALLYSGGIYIFALGDASRMEMAKKNITWTVVGILAVALIYIVIRIAIQITSNVQYGPGTTWGG